MAIAIDYFGLAEAAAVDSKGTLTVVGFHPHFLDLPKLPRRMMISVVLIIIDDERDRERSPEFSFDVNITDPRGVPVAGLRDNVPAQEKKHRELPTSTTVIFSTVVEFKRYGEYSAQLTVRQVEDGGELTAARSLFIMNDSKIVTSD